MGRRQKNLNHRQQMTIITNSNIRNFVKLYLNNEPGLPKDLINIPIGNWDVSNVTNMHSLFEGHTTFNEPLNWDVSSVHIMFGMFGNCSSFNQDISNWDVSNVKDMTGMFYRCNSFNQDISNWDVSDVRHMTVMFDGCRVFNQNISRWNVGRVKHMSAMFRDCSLFNQDLSDWNVSNLVIPENHSYMFDNCPISEENKPIFNDDPNYLQRKEQKEQEKKDKRNKVAYDAITEISKSRKLPEQINTAIGSFLIDDDLPRMNQKMLATTKKTARKTVINEEPDVKMGIGGKKRRKSRKKRKVRRKTKKQSRK